MPRFHLFCGLRKMLTQGNIKRWALSNIFMILRFAVHKNLLSILLRKTKLSIYERTLMSKHNTTPQLMIYEKYVTNIVFIINQ